MLILDFKKTLLKAALIALGLCLLSQANAQESAASARDTVVLEGFINTDRTLPRNKVYLVKHNVKVGKNATLTIEENTLLLFDFNTTLVIEGGLTINGGPNSFAELSSIDKDNPGTGILIRGTEGKDINIQYAIFSRLAVPVKFDLEWYRANVTIENSIFRETFSGESSIIISSPTVSARSGQQTKFIFSHNNFTNNWGSIFIENLEDKKMNLEFTDNLITNNVVYGISEDVPSNTPVFGIYDGLNPDHHATISENSIFSNYQINSSTDTVMREISFGIQGDGEVFSIPNNYYRSQDVNYISSTFDHFYQNSDLPLLKPDPILTTPSEEVNPHIYKVFMNGQGVSNYDRIPNVGRRDVVFKAFFNKPVKEFGETPLESVLYDTSSNELVINPIDVYDTKWSADNKTFEFTVSNASFLYNKLGYIVISHFKDNRGFEVPEFTIGQRKAINNYRKQENANLKTSSIISDYSGVSGTIYNQSGDLLPDKAAVEALKALTDIGDISYLGPYQSLAKTWEVGLFIGTSNYRGTLTEKATEADEYHWSAGIYGQYNAHKWFSLRAFLWYGTISGEDLTDPLNISEQARVANFRNRLIEGSLTFHWHLLKYGTSRGERFSPYLFAGVAMVRNNPEARVLLGLDSRGDPSYLRYKDGQFISDVNVDGGKEVWIPLQPIGTEGQTVGQPDPEFPDRTVPNQYKKIQFSFPWGFGFNWIIRNSWTIGAEVGIRLNTTKYLDDVGGYYYDRGSITQLDEYGRPQDAHKAIVDANQGKIKGKAGRDKLTVPDQITITNASGGSSEFYTAALLANPSLIKSSDSYNNDADQLQTLANEGKYGDVNHAFAFNDARRTDRNKLDSYFHFGVTVSKILKRRKDKAKEDPDNDGLTNDREKKYGTNPKKADTDGDGLSDGDEVIHTGTDPLNADTDGDGILDGADTGQQKAEDGSKDNKEKKSNDQQPQQKEPQLQQPKQENEK